MPIDELLRGHAKDLGGGLIVRRLLPSAPRRAIGPFVFFDHFGPVTARPQDNFDVRPHPHIGLATVTYLFEGAMLHRDSLGSVQRIEPGAINWMTAGSGIVHSERTPPDLAEREHAMHGLQLWAALPQAHEECAPAFVHTPAAAIPECEVEGARVRLLIGEAFGLRSPVATHAPTLYADVVAPAGSALPLPPLAAAFERCVYGIDAPVVIDGSEVPERVLAVLAPGSEARIVAPRGGRYVILGGAPLDGHRTIWWNFVSSRRERIEQAKADWRAQRMGRIPGDDAEFIPLP